MSEIRIESQGEGHFLLIGELSFDTVPAISAKFANMANNSAEVILDLQGVSRTDSAGLALLIEWMRSAHREKKRIVFKNMPEQMLAVAKVSELEDILPMV